MNDNSGGRLNEKKTMSDSINVNMNRIFKCCFKFHKDTYSAYGNNYQMFINGFWIPGEQIDKKRKGKVYWINSAKIEFIVTETDEEMSFDDLMKEINEI